MFKIKNLREWNDTETEMIDDIGTDLRDELRDEVIDMDHSQETANHIEYYPDEFVVGAETYDVAVMDAGRIPGEYPPFNIIRDWVMFVKDRGANRRKTDRQIKNITWAVMEKIKNVGIDATWFVKDVLRGFTS